MTRIATFIARVIAQETAHDTAPTMLETRAAYTAMATLCALGVIVRVSFQS